MQNIPFDVDAWRDGDILASKVLEEETTANNEVDQLRTWKSYQSKSNCAIQFLDQHSDDRVEIFEQITGQSLYSFNKSEKTKFSDLHEQMEFHQ